MSGYTDSEKIQYALKTALYRTMQTSMSDSASVERSAPLRVFPTNIMKVNIIEAGKGDIGEDGTYVTGHTTAGQTSDLSDPESTVKNYKIICPVNNVITSITISALVGYGSQTKTQVDALPTSGQTYPLKQWFFRGHYSGSGEAAFNAANGTYDGLQLAWNSTTNNTTPSEADTVPHLKYYLQVQTNYTGVSHSSSADNITYEHGLLKGLIGLDSNFVSTIMVTQGEGGPSSSASLGTSGSQAGEFWFTQATAGILSFYGVTSKVDASTDLATFNTKYPMISYVRYTGETGFGAGTGGGGGGGAAADPEQAVTSEPSWSSSSLTTSFMDGNVGIGTTSPDELLHVNVNTSNTAEIYPLIISNDYTFGFNTGNDIGCGIGFKSHWKGDGIDSPTVMTAIESHKESSANFGDSYLSFKTRRESNRSLGGVGVLAERMRIDSVGNVGIGTTSPEHNLQVIKASPGNNYTLSDAITSIVADVEPLYGKFGMYFGVNQSNGWSWIQTGRSGSASQSSATMGPQYNLILQPNAGNVGIGTTSPHSKLHVNGNITIDACRTGSSYPTGSVGGGISFREGVSYAPDSAVGQYNCSILTYAHDQSTDGLSINGYDGVSFCTGSSTRNERMRINSSGNVGINNMSPRAKIDVWGYTNNPTTATMSTTSSQAVVRISGAQGQSLEIGAMDSTYSYGLWMQTHNQSSTSNTQYSRNLCLQPVEGNVGIGTTSPLYPLHVFRKGSAGLIGSFRGDTAGNSGILVGALAGSDGDGYIELRGGNSSSHGKHVFIGCTRNGSNDHDSNIVFKTRHNEGSYTYTSAAERMRIQHDGNVGIGTTSPDNLLHLKGSYPIQVEHQSNSTLKLFIDYNQIHTEGNNNLYLNYNSQKDVIMCGQGGNVGIGTTTPVVRLQVAPSASFTSPSGFSTDGTYISDVAHRHPSTSYNAYFVGNSTGGYPHYYSGWAGDYDPGAYQAANATSAYFEAGIMVGGKIWLESDERIKHGIEVINDSYALRTIRDIECYTYFYNDYIRRTPEITLGFLAQEVREKFPMAVKMKQDFLPVAMTFAQDIIWEEIIDNSKNKFKLTIPILHKDASNNIVEHEPGTKFKFYLTDVSNNINNQDFCVSTLLEDGKSFILEKKSNYVFIYGYLVDDFHILDKEKIFTLHHSAIQEIDRIQQADKAEIAELKTEVATLKSELVAIKQHLGI